MSLKFYDSTNKSGIVDIIYRNTGADTTKYPLIDVTSDVNSALDKLMSIAIPASGNWQLDDSNHTDYPIITSDLVDGQRDYSFDTDEQGNKILDVFRVMIANADGIFYDLRLVDQQSKEQFRSMGMVDGQDKEGKPSVYDKTANGIFFDVIPDYDYTDGVKIFISREGSYFVSTDTTKVPGIDGRLHEYLAIRPSYFYALRKGLKSVPYWERELIRFEGTDRTEGLIAEIYGQKNKDERPVFRPRPIIFK